MIEYLKNPLNQHDLEHFLDLLETEPQELVRKDKNFKDLGLESNDYVTKESVVRILLKHPKLMQRPVILGPGKEVIARPSEKVLELLD